ncbi:substrate-binding domain-containing protein [Niabella soli]|uniref:ABC transporter substrate-binding protein n=1 Tax=Niabella soli DSM 19437 TaxID=929713 RepID=W0EYX9_9BACT|nr:substrate-binding domain-containing protein [Niabella soli]AHF14281.1 ABC transporter substrate-binding protein [Niabella soli DSM 19437]
MRIIYCFLFCQLFFSCIPKDQRTLATASVKDSAQAYVSRKDLSKITVGYCTPSLNAPFYVALEQAVRTNVLHYGMGYLSTDGQGDINKQVLAVEDLLAKGIKVLILNPLDPKALVPVVKKAKQQGVLVFIVDSFIDPDAPYISSVVANNELNGELLGEWVINNSKKPHLNIALISGNQGNPVGREKRLGFVRGLADAQLHNENRVDFTILTQGWGGWTNNGGLKAMEDILVAHKEVNILFAENDAMAIGALKTIKEMGLQQQIAVVGVDGQKEAYQLIKQGAYSVTAQNSPDILGGDMVRVVARYLNGEQGIKQVNYTRSVVIDRQNVDQFYNPNSLF